MTCVEQGLLAQLQERHAQLVLSMADVEVSNHLCMCVCVCVCVSVCVCVEQTLR